MWMCCITSENMIIVITTNSSSSNHENLAVSDISLELLLEHSFNLSHLISPSLTNKSSICNHDQSIIMFHNVSEINSFTSNRSQVRDAGTSGG